MTLRALIVDDEPLARTRPRAPAQARTRHSGDWSMRRRRICRRNHPRGAPDLVFLDIQMPEMDGFQVVEAIGVEQMPVTVFVTAFDRYAIRAFDANAVDYLLKPFEPERFNRALARARDRCLGRQDKDSAQRLFSLLNNRLQSDYAQRIAVATGGRIVFVPVADIDWIEAEGNYARLHVARRDLRCARDPPGPDGKARSARVHPHPPLHHRQHATHSRGAAMVSWQPHCPACRAGNNCACPAISAMLSSAFSANAASVPSLKFSWQMKCHPEHSEPRFFAAC